MKKIILLTALLLGMELSLQAQIENINAPSGTVSVGCSGYTNGVNRTWNIDIGEDNYVKIIYGISTETSYDWVTVNSIDASGNSTQLFRLSGTQSGMVYSAFPTGKIQVVFTTDYSVNCSTTPQYTGFFISFGTDNRTLFEGPLYLEDGLISSISAKNLTLQTNGTNRMTILNSNGNVGIGTNTPNTKLDVRGSVYLPLGESYLIGSYSDSGNRLRMHHNGSGAYIDYAPTMYIRSGVNNVVTFHNNGNVDIGNNLAVEKNILASTITSNENIQLGNNSSGLSTPMGYGKRFYFGSAGENYDEIYMARYNVEPDKSELRVNIGDDYNDKFAVGRKFWDSEVFESMLTVVTNGNVGIGVDDPTHKLEVDGTIRAKEVKIETSTAGWSDFVFSPDYQLPTLKTVEDHIKEHQHLPDIPSAQEVAEQGINLSEMQAKLLQKIEELTLYAIEQSKTIEELKQEIKKLKDDK